MSSGTQQISAKPQPSTYNPFLTAPEQPKTFLDTYTEKLTPEHEAQLEEQAKTQAFAGYVNLALGAVASAIAFIAIGYFARSYLMFAGTSLVPMAKPFYDWCVQPRFTEAESNREEAQRIKTIRGRCQRLPIDESALNEKLAEIGAKKISANPEFKRITLRPLIAGYDHWQEQSRIAYAEAQKKLQECDAILAKCQTEEEEQQPSTDLPAAPTETIKNTQSAQHPVVYAGTPATTPPNDKITLTIEEEEHPTEESGKEPSPNHSPATEQNERTVETSQQTPTTIEPRKEETEAKKPAAENESPASFQAKVFQLRLEVLSSQEQAMLHKIQAAFLLAVIQCPEFKGDFGSLAATNEVTGESINAHLLAHHFKDPRANQFVTFKNRKIQPITRKELFGKKAIEMTEIAARFKAAIAAAA